MQCTDTPTLTPAQQVEGLVLLWQLKDAMDQLVGTHQQRSRARLARLHLYDWLGAVPDDVMAQAKQDYAAVN